MKTKEEIIDGIVARFKSEVTNTYESGYRAGYDAGINHMLRLDALDEIHKRIEAGECHCTYCEHHEKEFDEEPCLSCAYNATPHFVPSVEMYKKVIAEEMEI